LRNDKSLMRWRDRDADTPEVIQVARARLDELTERADQRVFLGLDDAGPLFALDLSGHDENALQTVVEDNQFVDLRDVGWMLDRQQAAQLAYARGLLFWNRHHRFCGTCGSPTTSENGGHMRRCSVSSRFPSRMMSTLAGFVDPLESLEETVAREVFEECGIRVGNIEYQASQPWPFPSSIMLGFRALAESLDIVVDGVEIEEAYWFEVEQLKDFGEWGDGGENFSLPRRDSIARYLVESWIAENS
jgi:NAD+ diphosphatase